MSLEMEPNATPDEASIVATAAKSPAAKPSRESETVSSEAGPGNSFAEVALRLGGASDDEAKRTGVIDTADDQVEDLFAEQYKTVNSPIHRAVWDSHVPTELFCPNPSLPSAMVAKVTQAALETVRRARQAGTLFDERDKISDDVIFELGQQGYWGMLVDKRFGGCGASMRDFTRMITQMATLDPTVAGLASVHGCIGAVDPVRSFGTEEQKQAFLPGLGDGSRLSAFALTEPGAGSDLTALKTTAVLDGDHYRVTGEKLFITNATFGRTIGLVCKIDGVPSVLVVELPDRETESFRINRYGIYALRRAENNGLVFKDFLVPAMNRLLPLQGDGLTIAYHGLNLGRVSLCANAAGAMRWMMSEMLPWAAFRKTYGQAIDRRELVQRRVGHLAGLIVGCDALTHWCANLLDQGFRGEMECIIAKIFGSESQKEAAIELFMKTHGGRSFLEGHLFGDNVHDFLAPCIYEGEGEMLGMAFFKSLVKHHGKEHFEPIGRTLAMLGITKPNLANPAHLWALREPMVGYAKWFARKKLARAKWTDHRRMDGPVFADEGASAESLDRHVQFAQRYLSRSGMVISGTMRKFQLKLADRQCRMSALSLDIQNAVTILVTALYAQHRRDGITRSAADVVCHELRRRISGQHPSDRDFQRVTRLGRTIVDQGWSELNGLAEGRILQEYQS